MPYQPDRGALPPVLSGLNALIVGVANDRSIAWGCAQAMRLAGAEIAMTYLNDRALPHVEPLAREIGAALLLPLEVRDDAQVDALFEAIAQKWGRLDILVHSIAFAPREALAGRVTDCPRDGFLTAMDISCWSFLDLARRAERLMTGGGTMLTMSYLGANEVVENYGIMGPVKAALEIGGALCGRRTRTARHPRPCGQSRAAGDPRRLRHSRFRCADEAGRGPRAGAPAGHDRGSRRRLRVSGLPLRRGDDRRDAVHRRRLSHSWIRNSAVPNDSAEPLIGVINAGSSSLKFSFYEGETRLLSGQVDGIGVRPAAQAIGPDGKAIAPPDFAGHPPASPSEVLPAMLPWAREQLGETASRGARPSRRARRRATLEAGARDPGIT